MGIQINGQTDTISATDGSLNIAGTVAVNVTGDATGLTGTPNITVGVVTASSAVISGDLTVNGTTTTLDTLLTEVDKLEVGANNTNVAVAITQSGSGDILRLYDGTTQAVTVKDGGSVGIGTDNPNTKLHVLGGSLTLESTSATGNSWTYYKNADRTWLVGVRGSSGDALSFYDLTSGTDTERMRIDSSGNIGINTSTFPANGTNLKVSNGTISRILLDKTGTNSRSFSIGNGGTYLNVYDETADAERLRITSTGNVGIGTTSPANKLHIYQAADDYLSYGSNPRLFLQTPAGTNGLRIFSTTTPFEVGGSASTRRISIGSDPNYDISISGKYSGTTNDSSPKLFFNTTWYNGSANLTSFQGTIHSVSTSNAAAAGYLGLGSNANGNHLVIQAGTGNIGINNNNPDERLDIAGAIKYTGNNCESIEFVATFSSGTHTIASLSNMSQDSVAVATIEYQCLYSYVANNNACGIKMAATRRFSSNTAWSDTDNQNVGGPFGSDTSIAPNFFWDAGVLKITLGSSVQCTGRIRVTVRNMTITRNYTAG